MEKKTVNKLTMHWQDVNVKHKVSKFVLSLIMKQEGYSVRPLVWLCIGSDRYTGDSLGPLIGSYLTEYTDSIVFGTLDNPVHAGNFVETLATIKRLYHDPIIIAIDACLGKKNEVGNIEVWEGGLKAGIAVGNCLPRVGHISIIGVVNAGGQVGFLDLQSTPLSTVIKLSKVIGAAVVEVANTMALHYAPQVKLG